MTSEIWAALVGAAVAGGIAVLTQWVAGRQGRSASLDDARAARLGVFLAETKTALLLIGDLAYLPTGVGEPAKTAFRSSEAMQAAQIRVNSVLNSIQLLDDEVVVRAVAELDRGLVRLEDEALRAQWTRDSWRARRTEVLGSAVDDVYTAGRAALKRDPIDRERLWSTADRQVLMRVGDDAAGAQRPPYGS